MPPPSDSSFGGNHAGCLLPGRCIGWQNSMAPKKPTHGQGTTMEDDEDAEDDDGNGHDDEERVGDGLLSAYCESER